MKEPCEELAEAEPVMIKGMLPKLLNLIRIIWVNSDHFRTRERITGLLRKVCLSVFTLFNIVQLIWSLYIGDNVKENLYVLYKF